MKKKIMIYNYENIIVENGKFKTIIEPWEVVVMAIVDNWAMVRRKGCIPLAVRLKSLSEKDGERNI
jgi:hypothetical protein